MLNPSADGLPSSGVTAVPGPPARDPADGGGPDSGEDARDGWRRGLSVIIGFVGLAIVVAMNTGDGRGFRQPEDPGKTQGQVAPADWTRLQTGGIAVSIPPGWGLAAVDRARHHLRLARLELPEQVRAVVSGGLAASEADAVLIDQSSVDNLASVPEAQRSGEWIHDRLTQIYLYLDRDGGGASLGALLSRLYASVGSSQYDAQFERFAHPVAKGALKMYWTRESGVDWYCRLFTISLPAEGVDAQYCWRAGGTGDAPVAEILRSIRSSDA